MGWGKRDDPKGKVCSGSEHCQIRCHHPGEDIELGLQDAVGRSLIIGVNQAI